MASPFDNGFSSSECQLRSRRRFLQHAGAGFGWLALAGMLSSSLQAEEKSPLANPLLAHPGHFAPRAKRVIFCFMDGGPSHIDLFDPKPALEKYAGQPLPPSVKRPVTAMGTTADAPLMASKRKFVQAGQSGTWISDWLPETAKLVDDLCVIRSCVADGQTHVGSVSQMNTGAILGGRPCLGSWALYGLGTENSALPGFVVMTDSNSEPPGGARNWATGFMPATYQGTKLYAGAEPVLFTKRPADVSDERQRSKLDFLAKLNARHFAERSSDDAIAARLRSYELAYRMQAAAPEAADLSQETAETQALYGMDNEKTATNGRNCLLARRMIERGVRFVQLYMGAGTKWDAHKDLEGNHSDLCAQTDKPIAGLLADLKRRDLLKDTLVIWGGEFGRTPMSESGDGRDHNPFGFTMWMAGGGVKAGLTYGATDELGLYAVEGRAHVHDLHATILHLLGLDHERLTFPFNGREERLTITEGKVIHGILA